MTSSHACAGWPAPARSATRARSTRWPPASSSSASGRATRLLTYLVGTDKTYRATIRLGQSTVTDDAEGDVVTSVDAGRAHARHAVAAAIADLTGPIEQRPSAVSAIKVDGKRSYARVRAGEQVELAARPVTVHRFDAAGPTARVRGWPGRDRPRRRGGRQLGHLRAGPRPRPRRGARRRGTPDRPAAYPGRAVRPRRGPHAGVSWKPTSATCRSPRRLARPSRSAS